MKPSRQRIAIAIGSFRFVPIVVTLIMVAHTFNAAPILAAPFAQATAAPEEPTAAPEEPTAAPEEPTAAPEEPTAAPPTPLPTAIPQPQPAPGAAATATAEPPTITPAPPTVTPAPGPATAAPAAPRPARLPTTADDGSVSSAWLMIVALLLCLTGGLVVIAHRMRR